MLYIADHLLKALKSVAQNLSFIVSFKASLLLMRLYLLIESWIADCLSFIGVSMIVEVIHLRVGTILQVQTQFVIVY